MGEVHYICQENQKFTLAEAEAMIPTLLRLSQKCDIVVDKLLATQRFMIKAGAPKRVIDSLDEDVINELKRWGGKVARLGVRLQGGQYLFDSGMGFWSWYRGEPNISHYLNYMEPFDARRPIGILMVARD
jgi:hypothetical protein